MGDPDTRPSLPAGLIVGAALTALCLAAGVLGLLHGNQMKWYSLEEAGIVAGGTVMCIGALALARQLTRQRAVFAQVAAAGFAGWAVARIAVMALSQSAKPEELADVWTYGQYAGCLAVVIGGVALAIAAGYGRNPLVALAAVCSAAVAPPPEVAAHVMKTLGVTGATYAYAAAALVWAAVMIALTRRASAGAAEPPEDQRSATVGLRRATAALWVQLGSASVLMAAASSQLAKLTPYILFLSAASGAIAMALFATALVRVARASGTALPAMRLALATFLAAWAAVAQAIHAGDIYTVLIKYEAGIHHLRFGWPMLTPIVQASGILVLLWSIGRLAVASGDEKLQRNAGTTVNVYLIVMGLSLALRAIPTDNSFIASFATTFTVCGLVLAAALCGKAAQAIEARPALATARLRANDPA